MTNNIAEEIAPILVKNPDTGRLVNVAPLFSFVNENHGGEFYNLAKSIDSVIEKVSCAKIDDDSIDAFDRMCMMQTLYNLRNNITNMAEYKEERRH